MPGADPDADAAALAWTTVFDSSVAYDAKAAYIADAEALQADDRRLHARPARRSAASRWCPTAVDVTGDTAAITYDVKFAGQPAYQGQDRHARSEVDGTWQVSREEFCGFMAAARNPCPAG